MIFTDVFPLLLQPSGYHDNTDSIQTQEHRQYTVICVVFFCILVCHPDDETCFIDVRSLVYYVV